MSRQTAASRPRREVEKSINQYGIFPVTVTRVEDLGASFRRVSLSGRSLLHAAQPISDGFGPLQDAYIKLLVPPPGASEPTLIELDENWRSRWLAQPVEIRGHMRTYTVSRSRLIPASSLDETHLHGLFPATAADLTPLERPLPSWQQPEIDLDFVLHQDADGVMGPGSAWAAGVQVGERVSILAPLRGSSLWASWNPGSAERLLLLADETALPALLSILRDLPPQAEARLLVELPHAADCQAVQQQARHFLEALPAVELICLPREGQVRGQALLTELHRILDLGQHSYRYEQAGEEELVWQLASDPQDSYVFIAGESSLVKTLRRVCVNEARIPKDNISFMGYWKQGRMES